MKKLFLILLTLPLFGLSQTIPVDSIHYSGKLDTDPEKYSISRYASSTTIGFATITPSHMITIAGDKTNLHLDFKGDSMVVSGDMKISEAAQKFIEFCKICYKAKIDSLTDEIYSDKLKYDSLSRLHNNLIEQCAESLANKNRQIEEQRSETLKLLLQLK